MAKRNSARWKLNCEVLYRTDGYIVLRGRRVFTLRGSFAQFGGILARLSAGIDEDELSSLSTFAAIEALVCALKERDLLTPFDAQHEGTYLERTYEYYRSLYGHQGDLFRLRRDIHIGILGCGGLGGSVAVQLVGSGIRHLTLVDADTVEPSNLNRQHMYTMQDLGRGKVSVLAQRLLSLDQQLIVRPLRNHISAVRDLSDIFDGNRPDLIVGAIDTPPIRSRLWITRFCGAYRIPVVFGGVGLRELACGPFLCTPPAFAEYEQSLETASRAILTDELQPIRASCPVMNGLLASHIAQRVMRFCYRTTADTSLFDEPVTFIPA